MLLCSFADSEFEFTMCMNVSADLMLNTKPHLYMISMLNATFSLS